MLNMQNIRNYSGETKIALMDNSTVAFLEQVERAGISAKELLIAFSTIILTERRNIMLRILILITCMFLFPDIYGASIFNFVVAMNIIATIMMENCICWKNTMS